MVEGPNLDGLDESERNELLVLLEERDRREIAFEDPREPLADFVARMTLQDAARTPDPEGFLAAHDQHEKRCRTFRDRLWEDVQLDPGASIEVCIRASSQVSVKAQELAIADGLPSPIWQTWGREAEHQEHTHE
jgi:hypothetical protein